MRKGHHGHAYPDWKLLPASALKGLNAEGRKVVKKAHTKKSRNMAKKRIREQLQDRS